MERLKIVAIRFGRSYSLYYNDSVFEKNTHDVPIKDFIKSYIF